MNHQTSSIHRIPFELWGEVFHHCSYDSPDIPLALSQVSHLFHQIISTTPTLWTHLHLVLSRSKDHSCLQKARLWFSRVGSLPVLLYCEIITDRGVTLDEAFRSAWVAELAVTQFLCNTIEKVSLLSIQSEAHDCAHDFMSAVSSTGLTGRLQTLIISNKPHASFLPRQLPNVSTDLPRLPSLLHLTIINHLPPRLSPSTIHNLQSLTITCPIRFPPIPIQTIIRALISTPHLCKLDLETRLVDESAVQGDLSALPQSDDSTMVIVRLPQLSSLTLKINNLARFLDRLLLPNLHTLKLSDLDGRRLSGAHETSVALRQLLVRMELPCEDKHNFGLQVLELRGVGIRSRTPDGALSDSGRVWDWCFRRMRSLKQLKIVQIYTSEELLSLITPKAAGWGAHETGNRRENESEEVVLPSLERLGIVDSVDSNSGPILAFRLRRPEVDIVVNSISKQRSSDGNQPFIPFATFTCRSTNVGKG